MPGPEPPAGPWASIIVPFPADHFPFIKLDESLASFSWSSWIPGESAALVDSISFRTRKLNNKPSISAWQMWTTDGGFNGMGIDGYQDLEEHFLYLCPGERFTACTIWMNIVPPNEHKACVGRVKLVTDRGQILDTAPNDKTLGTGLSRPVGGGLLCGALGKQASYGTKTLNLLFLTHTTVTKQSTEQDTKENRKESAKQSTRQSTKLNGFPINWDLVYA